jgi:hypothetical protein
LKLSASSEVRNRINKEYLLLAPISAVLPNENRNYYDEANDTRPDEYRKGRFWDFGVLLGHRFPVRYVKAINAYMSRASVRVHPRD